MTTASREAGTPTLWTTGRRIEVGRILVVGLVILLFWKDVVPLPILLLAVVVGLYPLVRTAITDLVHERKVGTEVFVTIATAIAIWSGEYIAGALLMTIILIAEFIADFNTDRARASIKALGWGSAAGRDPA
jgi:cation transport ATPase